MDEVFNRALVDYGDLLIVAVVFAVFFCLGEMVARWRLAQLRRPGSIVVTHRAKRAVLREKIKGGVLTPYPPSGSCLVEIVVDGRPEPRVWLSVGRSLTPFSGLGSGAWCYDSAVCFEVDRSRLDIPGGVKRWFSAWQLIAREQIAVPDSATYHLRRRGRWVQVKACEI